MAVRIRAAQVLLALATIIVVFLILSLPFPPPREWYESLFLKLLILGAGSLTAAIILSVSPRVGRALALTMGVLSLAQLVLIVVGISRGTSLSFVELAIGGFPWFATTISGALLLPRLVDKSRSPVDA